MTYIGNTAHEKDSFEFLIHDLKHMEHFVDADKYLEQVYAYFIE